MTQAFTAYSKIKTAILISGRGSNMVALLNAAKNEQCATHYALVISNVPNVEGLQKAAAFGVENLCVDHKQFANREAFEQAIQTELEARGIELVVLAGFMRVLTPWFISRWKGKLINIHPALLPAFPGLHTHKRALEAGVKHHGATVHFVDEGVDTGEIIAQFAVPVFENDTEESLGKRVLEVEHMLFPFALQQISVQLQHEQ